MYVYGFAYTNKYGNQTIMWKLFCVWDICTLYDSAIACCSAQFSSLAAACLCQLSCRFLPRPGRFLFL